MHRPFLIGLGFALAAYLTWGVLPLYWALLRDVNPLEVLAHRIIWTLPFAGLMVQLGRQWGVIVAVLRQPRQLGLLAATALLIGSGIVTALPVLWYVAGARRLPLATVGILFYLNPTIQFLLGVLVFGEPLSLPRLYTFGLIWLGIALYVSDGLRQRKR